MKKKKPLLSFYELLVYCLHWTVCVTVVNLKGFQTPNSKNTTVKCIYRAVDQQLLCINIYEVLGSDFTVL